MNVNYWGLFIYCIQSSIKLITEEKIYNEKDHLKSENNRIFPWMENFISFYYLRLFEPGLIQNKSSFLLGNFSEWSCKIKCWSIWSLQFNLKQRKVQISSTQMWEFWNIPAFVSIEIHSIKGLRSISRYKNPQSDYIHIMYGISYCKSSVKHIQCLRPRWSTRGSTLRCCPVTPSIPSSWPWSPPVLATGSWPRTAPPPTPCSSMTGQRQIFTNLHKVTGCLSLDILCQVGDSQSMFTEKNAKYKYKGINISDRAVFLQNLQTF